MGKLMCKHCGEPVNIETGVCTVCGQYVEAMTHARIVDMGELARDYGYTEEGEEEYVPQLFEYEETEEALPEILSHTEKISSRPGSGDETADISAGRADISGYLSRLEVAAGNRPEPREPVDVPEEIVIREPTADRKSASGIAGQPAGEVEQTPPVPELPEPVEDEAGEDISPETPQVEQDEEEDEAFIERLPVWLQPAYTRIWENGIYRAYIKLDKALSPVTERVAAYFRAKFPAPNRAKGNPLLDRMAVIASGVAALVVVIMLIVGIVSLFPDSLRGEWVVSEQLSVEFSIDGTVTSWVYIDGEPHVERQGEYTVRRRNGYNLLTIIYEDGVERRLYYEIDGNVGTFTNVDTNMQAQYVRA